MTGFAARLTAQLPARDFATYHPLCDSCAGELAVRLASTSFFKNNEFEGRFADGFTGIGAFAKPVLAYQPSGATRLELGVLGRLYFGQDRVGLTLPIFRVQQRLAPGLELVFGTLYGTLDHGLREPLYRFDRVYLDPLEYGLQFLLRRPRLRGDLWVDWRTFIERADPFQEEFDLGWVGDWAAVDAGAWRLRVPTQLLYRHKGGQVDRSPDPVLSVVNLAGGLALERRLPRGARLVVEPMAYRYLGLNLGERGVNARPFDEGWGAYAQARYEGPRLGGTLGYWRAERFIAPRGELLFLSVSESQPGFARARRELLTGKLSWRRQVSPGVRLVARAEAYLALGEAHFAHALGLYVLVDERFFVARLRR